MWIMLIAITASARSTGHEGAAASSASGGSRLGTRPASRMRSDARTRGRVAVGRLPLQMGQRGGEVNGVLAAAAGDLEDQTACRQHPTQHRRIGSRLRRHRIRVKAHSWQAAHAGLGVHGDDHRIQL